jgi:hypothetical protein
MSRIRTSLAVLGLVLAVAAIAAVALTVAAPEASLAQADPGRASTPVTTLVITSAADSGLGTLREALTNAGPGDTISFDTSVFPPGSPQTITLASELPSLQEGTNTVDASDAGVILDGSGLTAPDADGIELASSGNVVRGLQIRDFPHAGIRIGPDAHGSTLGGDPGTGAGPLGQGNVIGGCGVAGIYVEGDENTIAGNYLGTDVSGLVAHANGDGVVLAADAAGNTVGGGTAADRNLISGNASTGVLVSGIDNTVSGNSIGVDATGTVALGNGTGEGVWGWGVKIENGASGNVIGGATPGERNVISGNGDLFCGPPGQARVTGGGVLISSGATDNDVRGNYIGTDASGSVAIPNASHGVQLSAAGNRVGGLGPGEGNLISGNSCAGPPPPRTGIMVSEGPNTIQGNMVGTDASGTAAIPNGWWGVWLYSSDNRVEANLISGNHNEGLRIEGARNAVVGNRIGTDAAGTGPLPNEDGVLLGDRAEGNVIGGAKATPGGACTGHCNLISGNSGSGITFETYEGPSPISNTVSGNYIGTDVSGTAALGNGGAGIVLSEGASDNLIGGSAPAERNVVSGNGVSGIEIRDSGTTGNVVSGNYIGVDATGTVALGNGTSEGVWGWGVKIENGASGNVIGGATPGECNIISGNGDLFCGPPGQARVTGGGVLITSGATDNDVRGNYVGTDAWGSAAIPNASHGVQLSAAGNRVGGLGPGEGNLISGNSCAGPPPPRTGIMVSEGPNTIQGNMVGTDASGMAAIPNGWWGVWLYSSDSRVEANLISGNHNEGLRIEGADNTVVGNRIGTDAAGTGPLPNEDGILLGDRAEGNAIGGANATPGGACSGDCNLISGNSGSGITFETYEGPSPISNTVSGNIIGTDIHGTAALGNGEAGIILSEGASYNLIGGSSTAEGNTIAHNVGGGVMVDGAGTLRNTISHNAIYANDVRGIALLSGGNGELPPPVLTALRDHRVLHGSVCAGCTVEVFSDSADQGRVFEGAVTADVTGQFALAATTAFSEPYVTATATDAGGNTSEFSPPAGPVIDAVLPTQGANDAPNDINLYGDNYRSGITATLATEPPTGLPVLRLGRTQIRVTIPAGLAAGIYDLAIRNPYGAEAIRQDAYTVLDAGPELDDLHAGSQDLFSEPSAVREGRQVQLGLVVHRMGGDTSLSDVEVRFFDGDPDKGGTTIGLTTVPELTPDSSAPTLGLDWKPSAAGDRAIYAIIDPSDSVSETLETNNTVSRTITVQPRPLDTVPPTVDGFSINAGAQNTAVPTVTLAVSASDNASGSGMEAVDFIEFEYSQSSRQWIPVQSSAWLSYALSHPWTLVPTPGVRYLQAWAADGAGNISLTPGKAHINLIPASDQLAAGQVRLYRETLSVGETLSVTVTPLAGDPDLYVWPPTGATPWVSAEATGPDHLSVAVIESGTYQIEVYGYTATSYALVIEVTETVAATDGSRPEAATAKVPRTAPVVSPASTPQTEIALPPAALVADTHVVYLPLLMRK